MDKLFYKTISSDKFILNCPTRNDLLEYENKDFKNNKVFHFMPTSSFNINTKNYYDTEKKVYRKFSDFRIALFGIILNGQKACVILTNIDLFFDVKIGYEDESKIDLEKKIQELKNVCEDKKKFIMNNNKKNFGRDDCYLKYELKFAFEMMPFNKNRVAWVRITTNYFGLYEGLLVELSKTTKFNTFANNTNIKDYIFQLTREKKIPFNEWGYFSKYSLFDNKKEKIISEDFDQNLIFEVDYRNFKTLEDSMKNNSEFYNKIQRVIFTFDNENYSFSGSLPVPGEYDTLPPVDEKYLKEKNYLEKFENIKKQKEKETYLDQVTGKKIHKIFSKDFLTMIAVTLSVDNEIKYSFVFTDRLVKNIELDEQYLKTLGKEKVIYVKCRNEIEIIYCWIELFNKMKPDIVLHYNGSTFDWPWIVKRAAQYTRLFSDEFFPNLLCPEYFGPNYPLFKNLIFNMRNKLSCIYYNNYSWNDNNGNKNIAFDYKYESIFSKYGTFRSTMKKMEAKRNIVIYTFNLPGFIDIDCMLLMLEDDKKSKSSSLNSFLEKYNLGLKQDMKTTDLFSISERTYILEGRTSFENSRHLSIIEKKEKIINREKLSKDLSALAFYNAIDTVRTFQLFMLKGFLKKKQMFAKITDVSLANCFSKADSSRIFNAIAAYGSDCGVFIPQISVHVSDDKKKSYQGAKVLNPIRGLIIPPLNNDNKEDETTLPVFHPEYFDEKYWMVKENVDKFLEKYNYYVKQNLLLDVENLKNVNILKPDFPNDKKDLEKFGKDFRKFVICTIKTALGALDFSSLYPSIIMAGNLSPDKLIENEKDAINAKLNGFKLESYEISYGSVKEQYWFVHHDSITDEESIKKGKSQFGFIPRWIQDIFKRRVEEKKIKEHIEEKIDKLLKDGIIGEKKYKNTFLFKYPEIVEMLNKKNTSNIFEFVKKNKIIQDCNENDFDDLLEPFSYFNKLNDELSISDSVQYSLKILMNTLYGLLPSINKKMAAAVTYNGRKFLTHAEGEVKSQGVIPFYGDTDSLYNMFLGIKYEKEFLDYYVNKSIDRKTFLENILKKMFDLITNLQNYINSSFEKLTRTKFMKMAFEELLCPAFLIKKKGYVGLEHKSLSKINFEIINPAKQIFRRGLDMDKRNASKFLYNQNLAFLANIFDYKNIYTTRQVAINFLKSIDAEKMDSKTFALYAKFNREKANVRLHSFVKNMLDIYGVEILQNEQFDYIMIKTNKFKYDDNLKAIEMKNGDRMILYKLYLDLKSAGEKISIDINYYLKNLINQISAFLASEEEFESDLIISEKFKNKTKNYDESDDDDESDDESYDENYNLDREYYESGQAKKDEDNKWKRSIANASKFLKKSALPPVNKEIKLEKCYSKIKDVVLKKTENIMGAKELKQVINLISNKEINKNIKKFEEYVTGDLVNKNIISNLESLRKIFLKSFKDCSKKIKLSEKEYSNILYSYYDINNKSILNQIINNIIKEKNLSIVELFKLINQVEKNNIDISKIFLDITQNVINDIGLIPTNSMDFFKKKNMDNLIETISNNSNELSKKIDKKISEELKENKNIIENISKLVIKIMNLIINEKIIKIKVEVFNEYYQSLHPREININQDIKTESLIKSIKQQKNDIYIELLKRGQL